MRTSQAAATKLSLSPFLSFSSLPLSSFFFCRQQRPKVNFQRSGSNETGINSLSAFPQTQIELIQRPGVLALRYISPGNGFRSRPLSRVARAKGYTSAGTYDTRGLYL